MKWCVSLGSKYDMILDINIKFRMSDNIVDKCDMWS